MWDSSGPPTRPVGRVPAPLVSCSGNLESVHSSLIPGSPSRYTVNRSTTLIPASMKRGSGLPALAWMNGSQVRHISSRRCTTNARTRGAEPAICSSPMPSSGVSLARVMRPGSPPWQTCISTCTAMLLIIFHIPGTCTWLQKWMVPIKASKKSHGIRRRPAPAPALCISLDGHTGHSGLAWYLFEGSGTREGSKTLPVPALRAQGWGHDQGSWAHVTGE